MRHCKAFSLAEVLITLGVIGVVVAVTLPTLISNHNKHVWENGLKTSYSIFSQAFQKMMADDGVDNIADTEVFRAINGTSCRYDSGVNSDVCKNFYSLFKKYIKITKISTLNNYRYYNLSKTSNYLLSSGDGIFLSNGALLFSYSFRSSDNNTDKPDCKDVVALGGKMCSNMGMIFVDINGYAKPNTFGRDIYAFIISQNGNLVPYLGKDSALYNEQTALENNSVYWKNNNKCDVSDTSETSGYGCAARIIENGWKMDY